MKCIYCLEEKPEECFSKIEHVVPQAFGRFHNNFTLNQKPTNNAVCNSCNQFLGDTLEIFLARDSLEGLVRYNFNLKSPSEFNSLGKRSNLIFRVAEGKFKNAYCYPIYSPETKELIIKPVPQIGFFNTKTGYYDYFLFDQMPIKSEIESKDYIFEEPASIIAFGCSINSLERMLKVRGYSIVFQGVMDNPDTDSLMVAIERGIDDILFRAVSKIAFNYLAYWQGAPFVLSKDFDPIRNYILNGIKPEYIPAIPDDQPIITDEKGQVPLANIITLDRTQNGKGIIAQVSLLSAVTYKVCLTTEYTGKPIPITKGHLFDPISQEILELGHMK